MKTDFFRAALACALAACSTPTLAMHLNPRGLGQVLIYPYYTVNKNQDTLVTVVNTADVGKAVSIRFLEGYNGRFARDFFLFLSPHDVWSARISLGTEDDAARLFTSDNSCISPAADFTGHNVHTNGMPFSNAGPWPSDGGPSSLARTNEGHIEIVANGDVIPGSPTDKLIRHVQNGSPGGGMPPDCPDQVGWRKDVTPPTDSLGGSAAIVNVGEGTFFSYNADALADFTSVVFLNETTDYNSLRHANSSRSQYPRGALATINANGRVPVTLDYAAGIDAVSAVFMADAISNEYLVDSSLGANTDWVMTFPTKTFYVDTIYATSPRAPFVEAFSQRIPGQSNVQIDLDAYDREEGNGGNACAADACPRYALPYEVNVVSFSAEPATGQRSQVLGSALTTYVAPYGSSGWARIGLTPPREPHLLSGGSTKNGMRIVLRGLPTTGFMVYNVINSNAQPGKLANYSGLFPHRSDLSCVSNASLPTEDPCS